eukprot:94999-Rhodomonas_salina.1
MDSPNTMSQLRLKKGQGQRRVLAGPSPSDSGSASDGSARSWHDPRLSRVPWTSVVDSPSTMSQLRLKKVDGHRSVVAAPSPSDSGSASDHTPSQLFLSPPSGTPQIAGSFSQTAIRRQLFQSLLQTSYEQDEIDAELSIAESIAGDGSDIELHLDNVERSINVSTPARHVLYSMDSARSSILSNGSPASASSSAPASVVPSFLSSVVPTPRDSPKLEARQEARAPTQERRGRRLAALYKTGDAPVPTQLRFENVRTRRYNAEGSPGGGPPAPRDWQTLPGKIDWENMHGE